MSKAAAKDLTGQRFGKLTVICRDGRLQRSPAWKCVCDCGNMVTVRAECLTSLVTSSCGCLSRAIRSNGFKVWVDGTEYRSYRAAADFIESTPKYISNVLNNNGGEAYIKGHFVSKNGPTPLSVDSSELTVSHSAISEQSTVNSELPGCLTDIAEPAMPGPRKGIAPLLRYPRGERPLERGTYHWK